MTASTKHVLKVVSGVLFFVMLQCVFWYVVVMEFIRQVLECE